MKALLFSTSSPQNIFLALQIYIFIVAIPLICFSCKKKVEKSPCYGLTTPKAEFAFKEIVGDTAFYADTVYGANAVSFVSLVPYQTQTWKLEGYSRIFNTSSFNLHFPNFVGSLDVTFTGTAVPNTQCFPTDNGTYSGTKELTVLEQFEKPGLTVSPTVGKYSGAFTDTPNDIFTVRIDYLDSSKYETHTTGLKNFYWVSNMPKNYRDTTSEMARQYPELSYGQGAEMGYRCLVFGYGVSSPSGKSYAELIGDTLKVYHNHWSTGRRLYIGKRI